GMPGFTLVDRADVRRAPSVKGTPIRDPILIEPKDLVFERDFVVSKQGAINEAATKANLPPQPPGTTRLYRAESPTIKFEDVFKLKDFPAGVEARARRLRESFILTT
ncbi:hypothetical protein LCGC14_1824500, partial [marine sediment metagenome]